MKKLYLVNNKIGEPQFASSFKEIAKNAGLNFHQLEIKNLSMLLRKTDQDIVVFDKSDQIEFDKQDLFFIRSWKPYVTATAVFCFALEAGGHILSDHVANLEHNVRGSKLAQCFIFMPHGVRFPDSLVTTLQNVPNIEKLVEENFKYPIVLKQSGSKGEKVWLCKNRQELDEKINELAGADETKLILFQEYIENFYDIRVIVHYGKIMSAIARKSNDGFYNNLSQGGSAESAKLTDEEVHIALTAAELTKLELAGVDIVRSDRGPLLFEVNKAPDISDFSEAAGFDLAAKIAEEFIETKSQT